MSGRPLARWRRRQRTEHVSTHCASACARRNLSLRRSSSRRSCYSPSLRNWPDTTGRRRRAEPRSRRRVRGARSRAAATAPTPGGAPGGRVSSSQLRLALLGQARVRCPSESPGLDGPHAERRSTASDDRDGRGRHSPRGRPSDTSSRLSGASSVVMRLTAASGSVQLHGFPRRSRRQSVGPCLSSCAMACSKTPRGCAPSTRNRPSRRNAGMPVMPMD